MANKSDLYEIECITAEQGIKLADDINAIFQKTSAKLGLGISTLFDNLGKTYLDPSFDYKKGENIEKENFEKKKIEEEREKIREKEKENIKIGNDNDNKDTNKKKKGCCWFIWLSYELILLLHYKILDSYYVFPFSII